MAVQEHLDILKQGVETWNRWRDRYPGISPDLSTPHLVSPGFGIVSVNISDAAESGLKKVNLSRANLSRTNLNGTNLSEANLSKANLFAADLRFADLSYADMSYADLTHANLSGANVFALNLDHALVGMTTFGDIDMSMMKGLDTTEHFGPSIISIDTIYRSKGKIPEIFLKDIGVPDSFIAYVRSLVSHPIEYYTCFISYASQDEIFAKRLYVDLQRQGVRCWFAPEDLKIGDKFWHRIDESIRLYDKLLVVLSKHSIESEWVEREVIAALEQEKLRTKIVLFPITLDGAEKHSSAPWAADIRRSRHTGDFTHWKDHDAYHQAFTRLLQDLMTDIVKT